MRRYREREEQTQILPHAKPRRNAECGDTKNKKNKHTKYIHSQDAMPTRNAVIQRTTQTQLHNYTTTQRHKVECSDQGNATVTDAIFVGNNREQQAKSKGLLRKTKTNCRMRRYKKRNEQKHQTHNFTRLNAECGNT